MPACHKIETCGVMSADVLFATDSYHVGPQRRAYLADFFGRTDARAYTIIGHTDGRASDEYTFASVTPVPTPWHGWLPA